MTYEKHEDAVNNLQFGDCTLVAAKQNEELQDMPPLIQEKPYLGLTYRPKDTHNRTWQIQIEKIRFPSRLFWKLWCFSDSCSTAHLSNKVTCFEKLCSIVCWEITLIWCCSFREQSTRVWATLLSIVITIYSTLQFLPARVFCWLHSFTARTGLDWHSAVHKTRTDEANSTINVIEASLISTTAAASYDVAIEYEK